MAILLFVVVRSYAAQIAQQGQDRILEASGHVDIGRGSVAGWSGRKSDFPYAALAILSTEEDDRVFYGDLSGWQLVVGVREHAKGC